MAATTTKTTIIRRIRSTEPSPQLRLLLMLLTVCYAASGLALAQPTPTSSTATASLRNATKPPSALQRPRTTRLLRSVITTPATARLTTIADPGNANTAATSSGTTDATTSRQVEGSALATAEASRTTEAVIADRSIKVSSGTPSPSMPTRTNANDGDEQQQQGQVDMPVAPRVVLVFDTQSTSATAIAPANGTVLSVPPPPPMERPLRRVRTDEQRLLSVLMTDYDAAVRPVLNASNAVNLRIGLTLTQIDVDERNQVLTTLVWLDQEWKDENLYWNPEDYNGLRVLRVPCRKLWLPDIVLYNSVEDLRDGYMPALAMVSHDGNVFWPPIVKFRGNCIIDIKYFPFDDQVCKMKLGSWAYDGNQVNLTKRRDGIDLSNYVLNGEWELLSTEVVRNMEIYPCCPEPYLDVTFTLHLRRRTLYYTYNIVIPCVMLSILTLLSFWMKPDSGEKINLGLTILLAFSVFMLLIAENMPATSFHVPIIGVYITSSMCITALSVVVAVLVSNINQQGSGNNSVPRWLHRAMHGLSILMCVKMASWEERHCNIRQLAKAFISPAAMPNGNSGGGSKKGGLSRKPATGGSGKNGHALSPGIGVIDDDCLLLTKNGTDTSSGGGSGGGGGGVGNDEDPLLSRLHSIIEHQEILLKQQTAHDDWHSVAIVVDRCLFWLYLILMVIVSMTTLVIFPLSKEQAYSNPAADQLIGH